MSVCSSPSYQSGITLPITKTETNSHGSHGKVIEVSLGLHGKTTSSTAGEVSSAAKPFTNLVFIRPADVIVKSEKEDYDETQIRDKQISENSATTNVKASHNGHIYLVSSNGNLKQATSIATDPPNDIAQDVICPNPTVMPGTSIRYRTPGASFVNRNGKIKRPMNAFMLWARVNRGKLALDMPNASNAEISVRLGQVWAGLPANEKQLYYVEAERIKNKHRRDFPGWVYQPRQNKKLQQTADDQHLRLWHRYTTQYVKPMTAGMLESCKSDKGEAKTSSSYISIAPASSAFSALDEFKTQNMSTILSPITEGVATSTTNEKKVMHAMNSKLLEPSTSDEKPTAKGTVKSDNDFSTEKDGQSNSKNITNSPVQAKRGRPPTVTSRVDDFISRSVDVDKNSHKKISTVKTGSVSESVKEASKKPQAANLTETTFSKATKSSKSETKASTNPKVTEKTASKKHGKQNSIKQPQDDKNKTTDILWPFPIPQTEKTQTEQILFAEDSRESNGLHLELADPYDPFYFEKQFDQRVRSPKDLQLDVTSWQQYLNNDQSNNDNNRQKLDNYFAASVSSCPSDIDICPIPAAATIKREPVSDNYTKSSPGEPYPAEKCSDQLQPVISCVTSLALEKDRTAVFSSSNEEIGNAISQAVSVLQNDVSEVCSSGATGYSANKDSASDKDSCSVAKGNPTSLSANSNLTDIPANSSLTNVSQPHKMRSIPSDVRSMSIKQEVDKRPFKKRSYKIMQDAVESDQQITSTGNPSSNYMTQNVTEKTNTAMNVDQSDDEMETADNALYIDLSSNEANESETIPDSSEMKDDIKFDHEQKKRKEAPLVETQTYENCIDVSQETFKQNETTAHDAYKRASVTTDNTEAANNTCDGGDGIHLDLYKTIKSENEIDLSNCKTPQKSRKRSRRMR